MWALSRHVRRAYRGVRKVSTLSLASRDRLISNRALTLPISQSAAAATVPFRNYAAQTAYKQNIDPLLQRLDEDVRRFGRLGRKDLDKLIDGIKIQKEITSSQALLIIRCCGDLVPDEFPTERTKLAEELWKTFLKQKTPMDISHYNALLRVYIENGHNFSTEEFLKDLEAKGLEPNRVTYQRFMLYYCQKGDVEKASHILETMRAKNLPLNAAVLDALVLGHIRQGNMAGVDSVLKAMSSAGLNPTSHTYAIMMGGHARKGDIESVKKILEDTTNQEIYFSDKDLMDVVEELADGGHGEHVGFILSQMQRAAGYNQEAINLIYKLINKRHYDISIQVLESMLKSSFYSENSTPNFQASFFMKQLIKTNTPIDLIVSLSKKLQISNVSPKAVQIATNIAVQQGKFELSIALFNALKEMKEPVRLHYFWPLFASSKENTVLEVLRCMVDEFELNTNVETMKDYILPRMKRNNPLKLIEALRENGASSISTIRSVLHCVLQDNRIIEASEVVSTYGAKTDLRNLWLNLARAFTIKQDVGSLINILNIACSEEIVAKTNQNENADEIIKEIKSEQRDILGNLLAFLMQDPKITEKTITSILEGFLSNNLAISSESLEKIQIKCKTISNENIELLNKLSNNDLNPDGYDKVNSPPTRRNPQQLENLINTIESKGENANKLRRQLLQTYCRLKDVENAERVINECEEKKFVMTGGIMAIIFEMYSSVGNSAKAAEYLEKIRSTEPDFTVDSLKMIKYALLLIKEDMLDKGIKILEELPRKTIEEFDESHFVTRMTYQNILDLLSEKCSPDKVKAVFNMIAEKNLIKPSGPMLAPIIKCHLKGDDLNSALDAFESCCNQYKCTPYKPELIRQLIMKEDANGLQKLTDLSTTVHGEINSLYDLVFGFVECDRLKQARRILETPGMRIGNKRLIDVSKHYIKFGMIEQLEKLIEVTKDLSHIERITMFESLLNHYISTENTEKCLGLWTTLQEESVPPSDEFLITLSKYLESKNLSVPFIVPTLKSKNEIVKQEINTNAKRQTRNFDKNAKRETRSFDEKHFEAFKGYLEEGNFEQAKDVVVNLLNNSGVSSNFLKFAVNKFSVNGKFEILNDLNTLLSVDQKKLVSFDNKLCYAMSLGGQADAYLDILEQRLSTVTEDNKKEVDNMFPKGGIMGILSNRDQFDRAKDIIEKYAAKGLTGPINSLWAFYLTEGDYKKADIIWEQHLKNCNVIFFQKVLENSRKNNDINVLKKLIENLKTNSNVTKNALGSVYSQQLDILHSSNNLDDACKVLDAIVNDGIPLSSLNTRKLRDLKNTIEASGRTFKYEF